MYTKSKIFLALLGLSFLTFTTSTPVTGIENSAVFSNIECAPSVLKTSLTLSSVKVLDLPEACTDLPVEINVYEGDIKTVHETKAKTLIEQPHKFSSDTTPHLTVKINHVTIPTIMVDELEVTNQYTLNENVKVATAWTAVTPTEFCTAVTVKTQSVIPEKWEVKFNLKTNPFNGDIEKTNYQVTPGYKITIKDEHVIVTGDTGKEYVNRTSSEQFTLCNYKTPKPVALSHTKYELNLNSQPNHTTLHSCKQFSLKTKGEKFPAGWNLTVDLSDIETVFREPQSNKNAYGGFTLTPVGDGFYYIEGSSWGTSYVEDNKPVEATICAR